MQKKTFWLVEGLEDEEDPGVVERLEALDAELAALGERRRAYDPEDIARAGVFVVLGSDGVPRIEAGFVRPEDEAPAPADDPEPSTAELPDHADEDDEPTSPSALPDRLVADLTAHRTAALRRALGEDPDIALAAVVHALAPRNTARNAHACGHAHVPAPRNRISANTAANTASDTHARRVSDVSVTATRYTKRGWLVASTAALYSLGVSYVSGVTTSRNRSKSWRLLRRT